MIIFTMQVRGHPANKPELLPTLRSQVKYWKAAVGVYGGSNIATRKLSIISGVLGSGFSSCRLKYLPHLLHCCLKLHIEHFISSSILSFSPINMKISLERKYIIIILSWSYFTIS